MNDVIGVDTDWMVQLAFAGHPNHTAATGFWNHQVALGTQIGLTPQVLAEFVHLVTDGRRFETPCRIDEAIGFASRWWRAAGVAQLFPSNESVKLAWDWMQQFRLGRKRVLDTQLAAIFLRSWCIENPDFERPRFRRVRRI